MKLTSVVLIILILASCGNKYDCPKEMLHLAYKGYAINEIDTVIIKKFKKGSNFSVFLDSLMLTGPFNRQSDTTYIHGADYYTYFDGSNDIKIINPFDNKTVLVSNVTNNIVESRNSVLAMDRRSCVSPVTSYTIDGITVKNTNEVFIPR